MFVCAGHTQYFLRKRRKEIRKKVFPLCPRFFAIVLYVFPPWRHNSALLDTKGEKGGRRRVASSLERSLTERSLLFFLFTGWPFGSAALLPFSLALACALAGSLYLTLSGSLAFSLARLAPPLSPPPSSVCCLATEGWSNRSRGRAIHGADWRMIY